MPVNIFAKSALSSGRGANLATMPALYFALPESSDETAQFLTFKSPSSSVLTKPIIPPSAYSPLTVPCAVQESISSGASAIPTIAPAFLALMSADETQPVTMSFCASATATIPPAAFVPVIAEESDLHDFICASPETRAAMPAAFNAVIFDDLISTTLISHADELTTPATPPA